MFPPVLVMAETNAKFESSLIIRAVSATAPRTLRRKKVMIIAKMADSKNRGTMRFAWIITC